MPIFEYYCAKCNYEFEEIVLNKNEHVVCPKCSSSDTHKLMSCCRSKIAGGSAGLDQFVESSSGGVGGCAGCSGGSCATCG